MTTLLQQAFAEASKLPAKEQDQLAVRLLADVKKRLPAGEPSGWPPGFFESTFGSITDETFVRHPQGEYEQRPAKTTYK